MRFVHQKPNYDGYRTFSNFFPDKWTKAGAPRIYTYGCDTGASPCTGAARRAMDPGTGQFVGTSGQASLIVGTLVPNSGNTTNGLDPRRHSGHSETGLHLPGSRLRAAIRRRLGRQRRPEVRGPRRRGSVLRSASLADRLRHRQQPAVLTERHGSIRLAAGHRHGRAEHQGGSCADRVPVRQQAAGVDAVERRRADDDAVSQHARRVVHGPAQLQRPGDGEPEHHRLRNGLSRFDAGSDADDGRRDDIARQHEPRPVRYYHGYGNINQNQPIGTRTYHSIQLS